MLKKHQAASTARRVLSETELALDNALSRASQLMAELPALRRQAGLSTTVGQTVLRHAGETITALVSAQASMTAAHNALEQVRLDHRIVAVGPDEEKPPQANPAPVPVPIAVAA